MHCAQKAGLLCVITEKLAFMTKPILLLEFALTCMEIHLNQFSFLQQVENVCICPLPQEIKIKNSHMFQKNEQNTSNIKPADYKLTFMKLMIV